MGKIKLQIILKGFWNLRRNRVQTAFVNKVSVSEKAQEVSYFIAEIIAQKRKSYTVVENLIMPACKIIVDKMQYKKLR